jgi:hypothetical protein
LIVGLCSSYKEGPLVQGAIRSLLQACDRVVVFEGPAGTPLDEDVPLSDFTPYGRRMLNDYELDFFASDLSMPLTIQVGIWSTDAKKRTAMIEHLRPEIRAAEEEEPVWGVWIDGDEVLCNPEYLRDWLNFADWKEQETGVKNMGWPLKLVEMTGDIAIVQAKVLRIDRLDSYSVSSSVFRNAMGALESRGNYRASISDFPIHEQLRQLGDPDGGYLFAWPPLPCEPYIMHRSALRHPRRSGLRLLEQEAVEIEKAKAAGLGVES